jgi:hypothetical protein
LFPDKWSAQPGCLRIDKLFAIKLEFDENDPVA